MNLQFRFFSNGLQRYGLFLNLQIFLRFFSLFYSLSAKDAVRQAASRLLDLLIIQIPDQVGNDEGFEKVGNESADYPVKVNEVTGFTNDHLPIQSRKANRSGGARRAHAYATVISDMIGDLIGAPPGLPVTAGNDARSVTLSKDARSVTPAITIVSES